MDVSKMSRFEGPVSPSMFPQLTITLGGLGLLFMAWFFVFQVTSTKYSRNLFRELGMAAVAALFLGFGAVFLMLWVGIYV